MMTKLSVEITTSDKEGRIGTTALSELLYSLHRMVGAPDFIVLQGPPGVRTVIQYMVVSDPETDATLNFSWLFLIPILDERVLRGSQPLSLWLSNLPTNV